MDGTLLDLHFDNYFWLEHVPRRYAQRRGLTVGAAKEELTARYAEVQGSLQWYCLDHWSRELELDIVALKHEIVHLIAVHTHVSEFLDALRRARKRVVLLTNAHGASLRLKLDRTGIEGHFDRVISAHQLGLAKEAEGFWEKLEGFEPYAPQHTLMVDDNLDVLRAAADHGVRHLLAVRFPDTRRPAKHTGEFEAIDDFRQIMPVN